MHHKSFTIKAFSAIFLLVSILMFSGAEAAFCSDNAQDAANHECFTCQSGHDLIVLNKASIAVSPVSPKSFLQTDQFQFYPQAPTLDFFRPPIAA